jgi:AI-2 transport protein TqsA
MTGAPEGRPAATPAPDGGALTAVALCLVGAAAAWYLLKELAVLLRPLLLAVFLAYVVLPAQRRLRRQMPGPVSIAVLVVASVGLIYLLALMMYNSALALNEDLPQFIGRARELLKQVRAYRDEHLPWLPQITADTAPAEAQGVGAFQQAVNAVAALAAEGLAQTLVVGVYLLFLLLEARHLPRRVRSAFPEAQAERILAVAANVNTAMAGYLRVKVLASLLLAVPVALILAVFGVRFAVLWGVLTFVCNFIPYLGSVISCSLPLLLAFLQLEPDWRPAVVASLVLACHLTSGYLFEPALTGKAVGLSPLVILAALAFWGLCWGLTGMLLAVPLTVMLKIVLENVPATRPVARLLEG